MYWVNVECMPVYSLLSAIACILTTAWRQQNALFTLNLHASISHSSVIYVCTYVHVRMYVCMCMLDSVSNTFLYPTSGHSSSGFTCCVKVLKLHTYTNHCHANWSSKLDTFLPYS